MFVRFQARHPTAERRVYPGVFALANDLARRGTLSAEEWAWWRANNDWIEAAYPDPGKRDPTIFDRAIHPYTNCWFKETAAPLLARVPGYLKLLDAHGVEWVEVRSADPGVAVYEDDIQVIVEPHWWLARMNGRD